MKKKTLVLNVYGKEMSMSAAKAIKNLSRLAERIYTDGRFDNALAPLLNQEFGCVKVGISSRDEFIQLTSPRKGYLGLSFSGPSKVSDENLKRQEEGVDMLFDQVGDLIDMNYHGGTMFGMIKYIQLKSFNKKKITVAVMPWIGLWDYAKIAPTLPPDFPKVNYLAIEGSDYTSHASLFGDLCADPNQGATILFGGRTGAYLEAEAGRKRGKPVLCVDLDSGTTSIPTFKKGAIVLPSVERLVGCLMKNFLPSQRKFNGGVLNEFLVLDEYLRDNRVTNMGFTSTSGSFSNIPYMRNLLTLFFSLGVPVEMRGHTEETAGGTGYGGVDAANDAIRRLMMRTNGLMCGEGLELPWCDCDQMFYVGETWGEESEHFLYLSDLLVGYCGGQQAKEEIQKAAVMGGRYGTLSRGIPVVCLYDEVTQGATWELFREGYRHDNVRFFNSRDIVKAADHLKNLLVKLKKY